MTTAKKYYATRDFNDAGTERSFVKGAELAELKPGQIDNYVAAGLASPDKPGADTATNTAA